jgi:DNA-binding FrmR family transcriptional regulator
MGIDICLNSKVQIFKFQMKDIRSSTIARLHRLEGQIRGVERLIDRNQPLPIVLQQLEAVSAAVRSLMIALITDRLEQNKDGTVAVTPEEASWIKKLLR